MTPEQVDSAYLRNDSPQGSASGLIELERVSKAFGSVRALQEITLDIAPARTTVLIGPSGCGKSTILRLIIGLIQPDSGQVRFEGITVQPENVRELRLKMGYVIQEGGLFPHMTAGENVALMARRLGQTAAEISARVHDLAGLVQLPTNRLRDYPAQLSGGQRQRVSLMRALMLDPDVLLMDEPLGSLDPMIRARLQEELKEIFRTLRKTVVLVTHDIGEAAFFADHIALLRRGSIVQQGPPKALIREPTDPFVDEFIRAQRPPLMMDGEGPS